MGKAEFRAPWKDASSGNSIHRDMTHIQVRELLRQTAPKWSEVAVAPIGSEFDCVDTHFQHIPGFGTADRNWTSDYVGSHPREISFMDFGQSRRYFQTGVGRRKQSREARDALQRYRVSALYRQNGW